MNRTKVLKLINTKFQHGDLVKWYNHDNRFNQFGIYLSNNSKFTNNNVIYLKYLPQSSLDKHIMFIPTYGYHKDLEKHETFWFPYIESETLINHIKKDIGSYFKFSNHEDLQSVNLTLLYIMCKSYDIDFRKYVDKNLYEGTFISKLLNEHLNYRD